MLNLEVVHQVVVAAAELVKIGSRQQSWQSVPCERNYGSEFQPVSVAA